MMRFGAFVLACLLVIVSCNGENFTISLLYPYTDPTIFVHYFGAFVMAVTDANKDSVINNHNITLQYNIVYTKSGTLEEKEEQSIQLITSGATQHIDAFVGPGLESCSYIARVAATFDKPLIGYRCKEASLSNKEKFPTFGRTLLSDSYLAPPISAILSTYKWKRLAIVCERNTRSLDVQKELIADLANETYTISFDDVFLTKGDNEYYEKYFNKLKEKTRIIVFLVRENSQGSEFVYQAAKHGLANGEFVLIIVNTNQQWQIDEEGFYHNPNTAISWGTNVNAILTDYQGTTKLSDVVNMLNYTFVLASYLSNVQEYEEFMQATINTTTTLLQCQNQTSTNFMPCLYLTRTKSIPPNAEYLYNAVSVYYKALVETKSKNESMRDGRTVMNNAKGLSFSGVTGLDVALNNNLDQLSNFTLLSLQPSSNYFEFNKTVPGYDQAFLDWFPFGGFSLVNTQTQTFQPNSLIQPWKDFPPPDEPKCGFFGELCIIPKEEQKVVDYTTAIVVSVIFGILLIVAAYVGLYIYRRRLLLANLGWKIDENEIQITTKGLDASKMSLNGPLEAGVQLFTQVALYKSQLVSVKRFNSSTIALNRPTLEELRVMLDFSHENINSFLGLVFSPHQHLIVYQYCPKGSLQDVLSNDEIKLDAMFLSSFVKDIIKGMIYLHNSSLKSHGRLKSPNCIVDSRWMVKITDYGTNFLRNGLSPLHEVDSNAYHSSLLWTAPELLRLNHSPSRGTQKGDVYSFGIILQEVITRSEPYAMHELDAQVIIEKVRQKSDPPFRPAVQSYHVRQSITDQSENSSRDLHSLMVACQSEDPDARPTFQETKRVVRKLSHGKETNVFEHMVKMLETYSNHLENVVEDRTKQLIEEKRKTDELVYRMLPKFIADQLKHNNYVEAEWYDEVTIYFSDIVGFTTISGLSTPMQVVDLLNDLYTLFDAIIKNYDAYKVETIGDAYMVVSGLPIRNGHAHAEQIADLSLHLLHAVDEQFIVRHMPKTKLQIRIGVHSGSVAAGVVGTTMPRYCLFGDTVNKASRMEANGIALKIHISEATKTFLEIKDAYHIEARAEKVELKNVGVVQTYWLISKKNTSPSNSAAILHRSNKVTPLSSDRTSTHTNRNSASIINPLRRASNFNFIKKKTSNAPKSIV